MTAPSPAETVHVSATHSPAPTGPPDLGALLAHAVERGGSDLHLKVPSRPIVRINGVLAQVPGCEILRPEDTARFAAELLRGNESKRTEFEDCGETDLSHTREGLGRFRVNIFRQRGSISIVLRVVPFKVLSVEDLELPPVVGRLADEERGVILVTGTTGSGKSTTLAAMIDRINRTSHKHIVTIEDPIEMLHIDRGSLINQREVGMDTESFQSALRRVLRQDPDVIMIGELRDYETIRTAMTAAETGHLVLATLHTNSAAASIDRILDSFPAEAQNQARSQLASTLAAVISQQLIQRADGGGRVVACEVMIKSAHVESKILRNECAGLDEVIESGRDYYQMQSMNQALEQLVRAGTITPEEGIRSSLRPDDLKLKLSGMVREQGYAVNTVASGSRSGLKSA